MIRLSVSNLAWPRQCEADVLRQLPHLGVRGVEVAPTRVAPWDDLLATELRAYRQRLSDEGLAVSSLQAILFGTTGLSLLDPGDGFDRLKEHMRRVADIAAALGAKVLVFGSPRNRLRGGMPLDRAWTIARDRWRELGDIVQPAGAVIGIEPVPPHYGGDFLAVWADVLRMVQDVDHAAIRVHLDTGCVALGGGDIGEAIPACLPWLAHFHAAQPDLANFAQPAANHVTAGRALHNGGYDRWIAIEMREPPDDPVGTTIAAVSAVRELYAL